MIVSPHDWLSDKSDDWLAEHAIRRAQIGPSFIPTRRVLGEYFADQFVMLAAKAKCDGLQVECRVNVHVTDVVPKNEQGFDVIYQKSAAACVSRLSVDSVVLATGHEWPTMSAVGRQYLPSPWPISKLEALEAKKIGIIGSSLSAVDACLTLGMKNGRFVRDFDGRLEFVPNVEARDLKMVMHSRSGLLPSQRFHFEYPRIQPHQYINESDIRAHINSNDGFLSLDFIYEKSFKQTVKEKSPVLFAHIADMDLEGFVSFMYRSRQHKDQFEFMRREFEASSASIRNREPIFWKEILDDVAYTLNFYAKYLGKRDFDRARSRLMPLVAHVVAFLPQQSCEQLLALHQAGILSISAVCDGWMVSEDRETSKLVLSYSKSEMSEWRSMEYDAIVDCRGQQPTAFESFPFASLSREGRVVPARVGSRRGGPFAVNYGVPCGGVDVDDQFRAINSTGEANVDLFVLSGPHISGLYPYHPGLPFCNEATRIVAQAICDAQDVRQ